MNTLYPEHTPPAPPEGMKWEYRGTGWSPKGPRKFHAVPEVFEQIGHSDYNIPLGHRDMHYFEAVPILGTTYHGSNIHRALNERTAKMNAALTENPLDPKGNAGSKKAPLCMLPSFPLHEASWVLKSGADKYGPWNWRENEVCASTYRSAIQRHLDQWFDDMEDVDHETNRSHLAHVIANACILMDAAKHGTLVDDRPSMNHDTTI